jgi:predicted nucleic acid-binding protein
VLLDTTFLIDLQRGLRHGRPAGAVRFLEERPAEPVSISLVSWLEFAEGYDTDREDACRQFLSRFPLVLPDVPIAWRASRLSRSLRALGRPMADHDLWMAATALERRRPLVTKNVRHFHDVPGLEVITY